MCVRHKFLPHKFIEYKKPLAAEDVATLGLLGSGVVTLGDVYVSITLAIAQTYNYANL
jgi:hypothetical protein